MPAAQVWGVVLYLLLLRGTSSPWGSQVAPESYPVYQACGGDSALGLGCFMTVFTIHSTAQDFVSTEIHPSCLTPVKPPRAACRVPQHLRCVSYGPSTVAKALPRLLVVMFHCSAPNDDRPGDRNDANASSDNSVGWESEAGLGRARRKLSAGPRRSCRFQGRRHATRGPVSPAANSSCASISGFRSLV